MNFDDPNELKKNIILEILYIYPRIHVINFKFFECTF